MHKKTRDDHPFFSIIIPIYNAARYLNGCLHSILGQSFEDFEVICLDDASTDDSIQKYHIAIGDDKRFKLIESTTNKGVSKQRNRGMDLANGQYVIFVDADDYVSPDTLSTIHRAIEEESPDIVVYGGDCFPWDSWAAQDLTTRRATYSGQSMLALFEETGSRPLMCNKAYRKEMLDDHNCRLDESLRIGEDHAFAFIAFPYAKTISYIPEKLYHYRQNNDSSCMNGANTNQVERVSAHVAFVDSVVREWDKRGYLEDSGNRSRLSNWAIQYLFEDLLDNAGDTISPNSKKVASWFAEDAFSDSCLGDAQLTDLRTLRSLATMENEKPQVSIIMPLYNASLFLRDALASIKHQTMAHFEVIMVDDESTDDTVKIAKEFCENDPRFHLIQQEHMHAGVARNAGIDVAKGEYLLFLDSDDLFERDLVECATKQIERFKADICVFRAQGYDQALEQPIDLNWTCDCSLVPRNQTFSSKHCPDNIFCFTTAAPWSKLYRKSFIKSRNLRFQGTRSANDTSFVLSSLASAEKIVTLDKTLLTYRVNINNSLQSTQAKDPLAFYEALLHTRDELSRLEVYDVVERAFCNFALDFCLYNMSTLNTPESFSIVYDFLKETGFEELHLLNKTSKDFYTYSGPNYERMRFMQKNPPRSYQIEYPQYTTAPLIEFTSKLNAFDRALNPLRKALPPKLKKSLGRVYRRMMKR